MNLQEVAGGKKFLELLLGAVPVFTGYHLKENTDNPPTCTQLMSAASHNLFKEFLGLVYSDIQFLLLSIPYTVHSRKFSAQIILVFNTQWNYY